MDGGVFIGLNDGCLAAAFFTGEVSGLQDVRLWYRENLKLYDLPQPFDALLRRPVVVAVQLRKTGRALEQAAPALAWPRCRLERDSHIKSWYGSKENVIVFHAVLDFRLGILDGARRRLSGCRGRTAGRLRLGARRFFLGQRQVSKDRRLHALVTVLLRDVLRHKMRVTILAGAVFVRPCDKVQVLPVFALEQVLFQNTRDVDLDFDWSCHGSRW